MGKKKAVSVTTRYWRFQFILVIFHQYIIGPRLQKINRFLHDGCSDDAPAAKNNQIKKSGRPKTPPLVLDNEHGEVEKGWQIRFDR